MGKKKRIILFIIGIISLVICLAMYFMFFYRMSGNNKNGKLILELTPDAMRMDSHSIYECYRATITNEYGKQIVSKKVLHVRFDNKNDEINYGKWEIDKYSFRYERVEESSSFFIFSSTSKHTRLVLHANIINELSNDMGINIFNSIQELSINQEYQFEYDYYPKQNNTLSWRVVSYREDDEPVLEVDPDGLIKAINYGNATVYAEVVENKYHTTILQEAINVIVPYYAESMELSPSYDTNEISIDEFRKGLYIQYYPSYSTNTDYNVEMDNPILEVDKERSDSHSIYFIPKNKGKVTVTVTTDNGVSSSINFVIY